MGDRAGDIKNPSKGVTVSVDSSDVSLNKAGMYFAHVTALDRLGNKAEKDFTVVVSDDAYTFNINGTTLYANDVYTTYGEIIRLQNTADGAKFYFARGYKTAAQMKYEKAFAPEVGFTAADKGYYTVLSQESDRKMYVIYVYVY